MGLFLFTLRPGILNKTEAKLLVQNWSIQLDSISQHIEQIISKEDDWNEEQTDEREECMFQADLTLNWDSKNEKKTNVSGEYGKMGWAK